MGYSETLNLPNTEFPMRANLSDREPAIQEVWQKEDLYGKLLRLREGAPEFILHDGPPYANGDIHIGTALNKVLKDIITRFASLKGYRAPFVPGWDTHGLPIELQALRTLGIDRTKVSPLELRKACRDYALRYKDVQKEQFKRLGVLADWEHPYLTLEHDYESRQVLIFGEMAKRGYIYRGLKPVYWCPSCETALADAEVEYQEAMSPSIYVRFKVRDGKGVVPEDESYFVIWTTTPWTLPANLAITLHPEYEYALVEAGNARYVLAKDRIEDLQKATGLDLSLITNTYKGADLEGIVCEHPFLDMDSLVILGEFVTLDEGTGCVHTAPGHGQEDFEVGVKYNLPVKAPIDDHGYFTEEAGLFKGQFYEEANEAILMELESRGALLARDEISHQYPHCWRCKNPVIFRATEQWFASVEGFRNEALEAIENVQWVPSWGKERIANMVANRSDWCISRQRVWGVPIPIFYCNQCGETILNDETIAAISKVFGAEGSDAWYTREPREILPPGYVCPACGAQDFRKETDIMDVWFDSGSSHAAVLESRPELRWPADVYLEGSDQHRGWFQSSLLTAVATRGSAPYRTVLTHGFVLDGQGRAMHKSLGNVVYPIEVIQRFGADVLRLWVASSDYTTDIRVSDDILKQLAEVYRKIRNTLRFLLGNLYDFNPSQDTVEYDSLLEIDRWALYRLEMLKQQVTEAYENYQFHLLYHNIHNFCVVEMSNFYLDVLKDRLYTFGRTDPARRSAQSVLYQIATNLTQMIAPILCHTAEEVWKYIPKRPDDPDSVHLTLWPQPESRYMDEDLAHRWETLLGVREAVAKVLEVERNSKRLGSSLEARVILYPTSANTEELLRKYLRDLPTIFIVSQVELSPEVPQGAILFEEAGVWVKAEKARGNKCERCWNYSDTVGADVEHPQLCERCVSTLRKGAS